MAVDQALVPRPAHPMVTAAPIPGPFSVTVTDGEDGATVLWVRGEVDVATAPALGAILASLDDGAPRVVVDLSQTTFIGAAGVHVLASARHHRCRAGRELVLKAPSAVARRVIRLSGMGQVLVVAAD